MLATQLHLARNLAARARRAAAPWILAAGAFGALAASAGCVPVVSLNHTEVRGASTDGLGVVAVLVVTNENAFDVEVRSVRAQVIVAGRYQLAPVDLQPNRWIPAERAVRVAVPLTIPWSMVPGVLASAGSSDVTYRIYGTADVTAGRSLRVRRDRYPVDQEGTIPRHAFAGRGVPSVPFF